MIRRVALLSIGIAALLSHQPARAAEITDLATALEPTKRFDLRFRLAYSHHEKSGQIKRELEGLDPSQQSIRLLKDLKFTERRDTLTLRAEAGIYTDLQVHIELPVVLGESMQYRFDQSAGRGCVFPPSSNPNCVNASNSTTVADGIVPAEGFDARNGGAATTGSLLFNGVARGKSGLSALDTVNLGLTWAPLSQRRDRSKPTWTIAFEAQVSVGNIKRFDRQSPGANRAVSEGVHRLLFKTAVSRRFRYLDPYVSFWYLLPVARGDSLFVDYGPSQSIKGPQMQTGTAFGLEAIPFERPEKGYRVSIDLRGRIAGRFGGRGYSEAWELLASAPPLACDPSYNSACDPSLTKNPYQGAQHTGLTAIDGYVSLGADIGVIAHLGRHFRARLGFDYTHDQSHFITNDEIGVPSPTTGRVSTPSDFNPAWRQVIDQPGRRYKVDNVNIYDVTLFAQVLF